MFRKTKTTFREEHYLPKRQSKRPRRGAVAAPPKPFFPLFLAGALWALFLGTGLYVIFFSPFLVIQEIAVAGNERIKTEDLASLYREETATPFFSVFSRRNYFLLDKAGLEAKIRERHPEIEEVKLSKVFPATLALHIRERPLGVLWCSRGPCYLLDKASRTWEGRFVEENSQPDFPLYRITDTSGLPVALGETLFDYPFMAILGENLSRLEHGLAIPVERQGTSSSRFSDELRLRTLLGWELYLNTRISAEENEKALRLFFEKELPFERQGELRYIDLRAENRVYYALKGDEGKTEEDQKKEEEEKQKAAEEGQKKKKD